ncbi:MBL fold metallo-hydrolase [Luethyella okanaganae]|uniref:MBL fold metallo-hydrolase n=1 Tax=Luethyella okanaganae TaxID=69372 RepID=A0ABW1VFC9_9MICO
MSTAPHVIALGTAGGPVWSADGSRTGIATAVVVGDRTYLVDAGSGVGRQLVRAGRPLGGIRAVFITHLHSDHIVDLGALMVFGIMRMPSSPTHRIPIVGPGPRGMLPPASVRATGGIEPVFPENPTPGICDSVELLLRGFATDINDRRFDSLRPTPLDWFEPREVDIPTAVGFHPNDNPTPDMEPFVVYEDDAVRVSATLVKHAPMAPAFGFLFETEGGSVAISGDTGPTDNMVRLACDADLLLHEALDFEWVEEQYGRMRDESARAIRDHHYAAHTSPRDAVVIAEAAGARQLALHHLVPRSSPGVLWEREGGAFSGRFLVPSDLDVIGLR